MEGDTTAIQMAQASKVDLTNSMMIFLSSKVVLVYPLREGKRRM